MKISQYVMVEGVLFKNSYLSPMLRCVRPLQANYIIKEVHEGACGMHAGARLVVAKIMRRETAAIREAKYKKKVEQYYNKRVCPVSFKVGDFVYPRNKAGLVKNQGKLGPNWEGPYRVIGAYDNGSYKLCTMNDRE
ncbi:hypothetical protein Tco_1381617, partial [Tanacetum coccineum]